MKTVPKFLTGLFCPKGPFAVLLILCLCLYTPDAGAQINAYAKVTAVSGATLSLSNANQTYHTFAAGEQIIVMQMQDNVIGSNTANTATFGTLSTIANAGKYEVATISSVSGMPTSMTLTAALTNTYTISTASSVQIISFNTLSTTNYTTTANIPAVSWNGNVGGVVAFQVGGTLTLANSVTADGQGFRGGAISSAYEVTCEPTVYDATSSNYAYKGEGIYTSTTINYTTHTGRGSLLNGGGGGSDDNGGGGGGGNYTAGGLGGPGWTCTAATDASGGLGGIALGTYVTYNRIFMGGGGGGGQQNNSVGTAGGNGGGIILIKAGTLKTSCTGSVLISANGASAATSGNDGAGGAGGAGTIVLQVTTFSVPSSCPLTVQANGGAGGNVGNTDAHGGGGGGGQGAVMYSASLPSTNVTTTANNGAGGLNSSSAGAASAGSGAGLNNSGVLTGLTTVLPINFLSFTGEKSGNESILYWSTGEGDPHQLFHVQRSYDGVSFTAIGTVDGAPGGTTTAQYQFTDVSPASGKNYYRILASDLSGRQTYSDIIVIDRSGSQNTLGFYPNPAGSNFTIRRGETGSPVVSVAISDLTGKIVWSQSCHATGNLIPVTLNTVLTPGIYFVRLVDNGQTQIGKLLII